MTSFTKKMRILVTGAAGQLGYDVVRCAEQRGIEAIGIDRAELDLTDEAAVISYFEKDGNFDAIIHCAAYTAVDTAEEDVENAEKINVLATKYLVTVADKLGAKFMYISTDYVFDGEGSTPFTVEEQPNPMSVYGKTKLAGEKLVEQLHSFYIVRISWVFGLNGNNFVKTMLQLARTKNELTIVNDQVGSPTYTKDLAVLLLDMIETEKYGVYLASNEGFCSWYDFANEIFRQANINIATQPVDSSAFPSKAKRPLNSRMDKSKLVENGFKYMPTWQDALSRYLFELEQEEKSGKK